MKTNKILGSRILFSFLITIITLITAQISVANEILDNIPLNEEKSPNLNQDLLPKSLINDRQQITNLIKINLKHFNNEDIENYLTSIDKNSPSYPSTRTFAQVLFKSYNLRAEIDSIDFLELCDNLALVKVRQITRNIQEDSKTEGENKSLFPYTDNLSTSVHIMRKINNRWKFYTTIVEKTETIKQVFKKSNLN